MLDYDLLEAGGVVQSRDVSSVGGKKLSDFSKTFGKHKEEKKMNQRENCHKIHYEHNTT
jgi:hypothetical protein